MNNKKIKHGEVIVYKNKVEVRLEAQTVWLNLNQMAGLFGRDKSVISRHMSNIFREKELSKKSTVAKFATVQREGKRKVERNVDFYSLADVLRRSFKEFSKAGCLRRSQAADKRINLTVSEVRKDKVQTTTMLLPK